ncbi:MAG: hypothetical protein Q9227_006489 [Pyrenula ochraceoflavens]
MAWGHATSQDLMSWKVVSHPVLRPDKPYDREGVFTGCMQPASLRKIGSPLTIVYTSVSKLPIHYTLPYDRGCETLSVAQSVDGGKNWTKASSNPIVTGPPEGASVSGWRDPFVAPWPSLDHVLGRPDGQTLYGILSGGIPGQTPTLFLYALDADITGKWDFISPLVNVGLNHSLSRWSGDLGLNWEVANFFSLRDFEGGQRDFIVVGAEGCDRALMTEHDPEEGPPRSTQVPREARSQQWMCGSLKINDGKVEMTYDFGGRYDHGCLYGVNSIWDEKTSSHIAWGWITEEDLPQELVDRQNWSGLLSLPRELKLLTIHNVHGALASKLKDITSLEVTPDEHATYTVRTMGMAPARASEQLRQEAKELMIGATALPQINSGNVAGEIWLDVRSARWELIAEMMLSKRYGSRQTSISFSPATETVTIDRAASTDVDDRINTSAETAPHTLFTLQDPNSGALSQERLQLHAFFDESVLEVFANGRTVISTRVYPSQKRCYGIHFFTEDDQDAMVEDDLGSSRLVQARAWDGLRADIRIVD